MPLSDVRTFSDPDDYAASIRGSQTELTILGRGQFAAKITKIDLPRLWMQRFSDNLPRVGHSALSTSMRGRAVFSFRTGPGPPLLWGGAVMPLTNIVRHSQGDSTFQHSTGSFSVGCMSLPIDEMALLGASIAGCDLAPPKQTLTITATPSAIATLQRLHAAAGRLAEAAPEIIGNPNAARGLEQALIEAMVGCLDHSEAREDRMAQRQHELIMRRFRQVVEDHPEEPLYIPEICKTIGVSERTLRTCCKEHLGMSPKRYLLLRRMGLARRALRRSPPDATSVTVIGTRYGFWELGRFAVEYQALFGEPPSATLHRPAE